MVPLLENETNVTQMPTSTYSSTCSCITFLYLTCFCNSDHGTSHQIDGNRQLRDPHQTPTQGWPVNQEMGVSYKSMMEASPDDPDDLTHFFPTVRTVATSGRLSANSHFSVIKQNWVIISTRRSFAAEKFNQRPLQFRPLQRVNQTDRPVDIPLQMIT